MPDQQTSTDPEHQWMTGPQATQRLLASALFRIIAAVHDRIGKPGATVEDLTAVLQQVALLAEHAVAGKTTTVHAEYKVLWHGDDDDAIRMSEHQIGYLSRALRRGPARIGEYGITRFTVQFRTHVAFGDGSTWISGWESVDYRGTLFPCPDCGTTVFRSGNADHTLLLDADPAPDGELVLIPNVEHGGEPGAIYGEQHHPGQTRYHRHQESRTVRA